MKPQLIQAILAHGQLHCISRNLPIVSDQIDHERPRLWENAWDEAADALCSRQDNWDAG